MNICTLYKFVYIYKLVQCTYVHIHMFICVYTMYIAQCIHSVYILYIYIYIYIYYSVLTYKNTHTHAHTYIHSHLLIYVYTQTHELTYHYTYVVYECYLPTHLYWSYTINHAYSRVYPDVILPVGIGKDMSLVLA